MRRGLLSAAAILMAGAAAADSIRFKNPTISGMHFTEGQTLVFFFDVSDSRSTTYGEIVCPSGGYTYPAGGGPVTCSNGGTPSRWPQFEVYVGNEASPRMDSLKGVSRISLPLQVNENGNPIPIGFWRFNLAGLAAGTYQIRGKGFFNRGANSVMSDPITIIVDPEPAKTVVNLTANVSGSVNWTNVLVRGNGFTVNAGGGLVIKDSLVTGLGSISADGYTSAVNGITGTVDTLDIQGSIFENTGMMDITLNGGADARISNNEFRANVRALLHAPGVGDYTGVDTFIRIRGGDATPLKYFQGNRMAAGSMMFHGSKGWLVGGDTDDKSNIFLGPRCGVDLVSGASDITLRGNYSHHTYGSGWSQGMNFYYQTGGSANVVTEHNFIMGGSWPIQDLRGEFRYNVVYGYDHTWIRTIGSGGIVHHNLFLPKGEQGQHEGGIDGGNGSNLQIHNNTFDGGGNAYGEFQAPMIILGGSGSSVRNNLFTHARNQTNGNRGWYNPRSGAYLAGVSGGGVASADYNAFYNPDNTNPDNYQSAGFGAHDVKEVQQAGAGELAAHPFAGTRVLNDGSVFDDESVWHGTRKMSQILGAFRARYTPLASVIDKGSPAGVDIGAIEAPGGAQQPDDKFGKFGTPPAETVKPTVSLTAPSAGATLEGTATLTATASDNVGVFRVDFLIDGVLQGWDDTPPYSLAINAGSFSSGNHVFKAHAWDAAGNMGVSPSVTAAVVGDRMPPAKPGIIRIR